MNANAFVIGSAPDFLMKSGAVAVYHAAVITLDSCDGCVRKLNCSHRGFPNLTKEISETLPAFGWTRDVQIIWSSDLLIGLEFKSFMGAVAVHYKTHPQVTPNLRRILGREFR